MLTTALPSLLLKAMRRVLYVLLVKAKLRREAHPA